MNEDEDEDARLLVDGGQEEEKVEDYIEDEVEDRDSDASTCRRRLE